MQINENVRAAEEFLIQVIKKDSHCKTFDQLRLSIYKQQQSKTLQELPPSSDSVKDHILRAYFICYQQIHCFDQNSEQLDPLYFGFIKEDGLLIPKKILVTFPSNEDLVPSCSCTNCVKKTCTCRVAGVLCCSFCGCKHTRDKCRNIPSLK